MMRARTRATTGTMPEGIRGDRPTRPRRTRPTTAPIADDLRAAIYTAARRELLRRLLADSHATATADDLRAAVAVPDGAPPAMIDTALGRLAYDGIIASAGDVIAARPERCGAVLTVWRLRDRAAAVRWLAADQAAAIGEAGGGP